MLKVILQAPRYIPPFNEPARDLRIQNRPLWLNQRDMPAPYISREMELPPGVHLPVMREKMLVYRDNLFFDEGYISEFMRQARKHRHAVHAAFSIDDSAFREHALPLSVPTLRQAVCIMPTCGITLKVPKRTWSHSQEENKPMTLTVDAPPDLPRVTGDIERVCQILDNLVDNAYHNTPGNG
jgi:hypothetical protein